jgi:broad specificity phosphatase PhoE
MTMVTWARHGENLANVSRTFSFRVYDESLTRRGCRRARDLAGPLDRAEDRGHPESADVVE